MPSAAILLLCAITASTAIAGPEECYNDESNKLSGSIVIKKTMELGGKECLASLPVNANDSFAIVLILEKFKMWYSDKQPAHGCLGTPHYIGFTACSFGTDTTCTTVYSHKGEDECNQQKINETVLSLCPSEEVSRGTTMHPHVQPYINFIPAKESINKTVSADLIAKYIIIPCTGEAAGMTTPSPGAGTSYKGGSNVNLIMLLLSFYWIGSRI